MKAFSTREDYAADAIEIFENMLEKKILPDATTF